jgi:hypothetical protein
VRLGIEVECKGERHVIHLEASAFGVGLGDAAIGATLTAIQRVAGSLLNLQITESDKACGELQCEVDIYSARRWRGTLISKPSFALVISALRRSTTPHQQSTKAPANHIALQAVHKACV